MSKVFHIYGDNIVECTRTLQYILNGFPVKTIRQSFVNITTPRFWIETSSEEFHFIFFPGTNATRWNKDIYKEFVLERGGMLKEGADALITEVTNDNEEIPIIAIEFSAALPAGNNAWQRSGRALSLSQAGIPYFYIVHLGGKEYKKENNQLATRFLNPALPLSFSLKSLTSPIPSIFVYSEAPEADDFYRNKFSNCYGEEIFSSILYKVIQNESYADELRILQRKNTEFLKTRTNLIKKPEYNARDYDRILESKVPYDTLVEVTKEKKIKWKKKLAKKIRSNFEFQPSHPVLQLIDNLGSYSYALITKDLPCTLIPGKQRLLLADYICNDLYKDKVSNEFKEWIYKEEDLVVCVINGFKPEGEDSRPDRGLPPLSKMLTNRELLTLVIGTAKHEVWEHLDKSPEKLSKNGLWQSIFNLSEAILVDTPTRIGYPHNTYVKAHWEKDVNVKKTNHKPKVINDFPRRTGEQDVDTAIHILFRYIGKFFECMCNPPGGDWSGISILQNQIEYRWTSMNRVSQKHTKRPDHIYQFEYEDKPTLLLIESKDFKSNLLSHEEDVGIGMVEYLKRLMNREYTAKREVKDTWKSASGNLLLDSFNTFSAVAYEMKGTSEENLDESLELLNYTNSHLAFALELLNERSILHIFSINESAYNLSEYIRERTKNTELIVKTYSPN